MRLLHDALKVLVDLGEDRFRRHEQEGGVLRLAGQQIFLRDRLDVDLDIAAEGLGGAGGFRGAAVDQVGRAGGVVDQAALLAQLVHQW